MLHLHVIQALHGDCLLLEYGDPSHYLLIDGGPQTVYASDLRPTIHATYPLADTAEGLRELERGDMFGKVVITV